ALVGELRDDARARVSGLRTLRRHRAHERLAGPSEPRGKAGRRRDEAAHGAVRALAQPRHRPSLAIRAADRPQSFENRGVLMRLFHDTFATPLGSFSAAVDETGSVVVSVFGDADILRQRLRGAA